MNPETLFIIGGIACAGGFPLLMVCFDHFYLILGTVLLIGGITIMVVVGLTDKIICDQTVEGTVTSIGGCDRYGVCGVLLDNGWKVTTRYPTINEHVNVCTISHRAFK